MHMKKNQIDDEEIFMEERAVSEAAEKSISRLSILLYFFTFAIETTVIWMQKDNLTEYFKIISLSFVMIALIMFYIKMNISKILEKKNISVIIASSYIVSLTSVMISLKIPIYNFWLIGVVIIAMIVDVNLGLLFNLFFSFLLCVISGMAVELMAFYFVLGSAACVLAKYIMKKSTIVYALVVLCCIAVSLEFIIHNFVYEEAVSGKLIFSLISIVFISVTAYIYGIIYNKILIPEDIKIEVEGSDETATIEGASEEIETDQEEAASEENNLEDTDLQTQSTEEDNTENIRSMLDELSAVDNSLILELKNVSEELYQHSIDISEISYGAAMCIGADELIVRVGGLYHEIGRIRGDNYIEEGILIAKENNFPQEIIDIIKQHNSKYEKPCSAEAAIVMLTDSVISTIEYMEKNSQQKEFTTDKIIDNVFNIRLSKGTLDNAGFTVTQYKSLREYYKKNFF